ncbi:MULTISPECIES: hypothetical protein [Vibrio]|uniref:hypothetical protein n=1 Tax=Vibrio TaxID=662 RepID=UPI003D0DADF5
MTKKLIFLTTLLASGGAIANSSGGNDVYFNTNIASQCGVTVVDESGTIGEFHGEDRVSSDDDPASADIINNVVDTISVSTVVDYQDGKLLDINGDPFFNWTIVDTSRDKIIDTGDLTSNSFEFDVPRIQNVTNIKIYVNQNGQDELTAGSHTVQFSLNVVCAGAS